MRYVVRSADGTVKPGAAGSIRLYAGKLYDLGPFIDFLLDKLAKLGRRAPHGRVAELGQACLQFRIGKTGIDVPVEPVDDLAGHMPGDTDPIPATRLVARHELGDARHVRQHIRALRGG